MNLWQKIVEVRKVVGSFSKDKKSYKYDYVSGNQVLSKIKDKMNDLNIILMPSTKMGEHHTHEYKTSNGKNVLDFVVKGEMSYTWINGDEPTERETVTWAYYGQQDDISKAFGSALTYSERYYLLKCLGLPTDEDDPDPKNTFGNQPKAHNKPIKPPIQTLGREYVKSIWSAARAKNVTEEIVRNLINENFNKTSTKDLTITEYKELMDFISNYEIKAEEEVKK